MKRLKRLNYLKAGGLFGAALLAAAPDAFSQANPAKLVSLWDFNDDSTPLLSKDKLRGITGTNMATTGFTADAAGRSGQAGDRAIDFKTAGNNFVRVPTGGFINFAAAGDDMTVTFWQKLYSVTAGSSFWFASPSSPSTERGFQGHVPWSNGNIYFDTAGCCGSETRINMDIASLPTYTDPTFWQSWHHFAFVKNGETKEIWIDGQLFHSGDGAIPLPLDFRELTIGATVGGGNYIRGLVDDFAVWGNALDSAQITQLAGGTAPTSLVTDTDGDGLPDWWEDQFGLNKNLNDASLDADSDGSTNLQEYTRLTDPKNADSDGDGLKDGAETGTGVWVSVTDTGTNPLAADSDGDGLSDGIENNSGTFTSLTSPGTSPVKGDTDGDGFSDLVESKFGGNPVDASKTPLPTGITKLLAYWDFNNGTDLEKTLDKVRGLTGILTNGASYTSGRTTDANDLGIVFGFDVGTSVLVQDGNIANIASASNKMTVAFWQRLDEVAATTSAWIESPSSGGRGLNLHNPWSDQTIYFDSGGATAGASRLNANISTLPGYDINTWDWTQWHHYVFVKNGNTKEIWVDGKLLIRGANTTPLARDFSRLWIGSQPNGATPVRGTIDDFAIFASALDQNRIRELASGKKPDAIETLTDTDNDGMPDIWEDDNGTNKLVNDASADPDADDLTNLQEFQRATNPLVADTDGDGLKDGVETGTAIWVSATNTGTNPLNPDSDGDGLRDSLETGTGIFVSATNTGSDPNKADTDGDGVSDGVEVALETSPVDASASPIKPGQPNLLAYWNFNTASSSGETVNDTLHQFIGVLTNGAFLGGATSGRTGLAADQAVDFGFDSAGQAIWVTNAVFLNAGTGIDKMSVSYWQKLYAVASSSAFWMRSPTASGGQRGFQAHSPWSDQTIYFDSAGCCDGGTMRLNANITTLPGYVEGVWTWEEWHHFAIVKDGPVKQIWIDGTLLTSGSSANPLQKDFNTMMIGAEPPNAANSMQGVLDDFAVFASGLTAAQVAELAAGKSPTEIKGAPIATLALVKVAGKWTLNFTGTLEASDSLAAGSWSAVANATTPFELPNTGARKFYRAKN